MLGKEKQSMAPPKKVSYNMCTEAASQKVATCHCETNSAVVLG
jgi:hypothetical protein